MDGRSDPSQADGQPAAPAPAAVPGRVPRWLYVAQAAVAVAVIGFIVASILVLRPHGPVTVKLRATVTAIDSPARADTGDQATPATGAAGGPLGALESGAPQRGHPAPDFALLDLEGHRVALSSLRGKAVVVNFWATWCGPCKQEFPELQKAAAEMSDDVVILALDQAEKADRVAQFRDQYGATFGILLDSGNTVANAYKLSGIPDTIFIDRNGVVRDVVLGPLSAGTFRYKIRQTLADE